MLDQPPGVSGVIFQCSVHPEPGPADQVGIVSQFLTPGDHRGRRLRDEMTDGDAKYFRQTEQFQRADLPLAGLDPGEGRSVDAKVPGHAGLAERRGQSGLANTLADLWPAVDYSHCVNIAHNGGELKCVSASAP